MRGPQLEVTGSVADAGGTSVMVDVNGQMEQDPTLGVPRSFRALVNASEGPLELVATARDAAGNTAVTPPRDVKVDFTKPVITLREPQGQPITSAASVRVEGTVSDLSPTTLTIDGTQAAVGADGGFSADVPLGEGEQTIALVATDSVGLVGTLELSVIVDRTAPVVQVVSPQEGAFVSNLPVVVEGTVTDLPGGLAAAPPVVTVDGQVATVTGQAWTVTFDSLPDGPHRFLVLARDAAGNVSLPVERNVVLDLLPPTVKIQVPVNGTLTRLEAMTVAGTAQGRGSLSVT